MASCDVATRAGLRDRAALELFYSTGLRRQELASLTQLDLDLETGVAFVRHGKGGKSRYVPVGRRAAHWVRRYLREVRPCLAAADASEAVFLETLERSGGRKNTGQLTSWWRGGGHKRPLAEELAPPYPAARRGQT
ncbi:MAG: tyrosine-type recombinase/integrase [Sphingopyxis sp.]|nr:tyrosine-type recombinase/integrase [Sphingopyxis sp.]